MIGCDCDVCRSSSPYNQRLRQSVLLSLGEKRVLVDAGPDVRIQALRYKINHLDGLFLTHAHYDHIGGLDDLRAYYFAGDEKPLPCFLSVDTYEEVCRRCPYMIVPASPEKSFPAQFQFQISEKAFGPAAFDGFNFFLVTYRQLSMNVLGFRLGNLAYLSDLKDYDPRVMEDVKGVDTLIISALRADASRAHLSFQEAVDFGRAIGAKRTWLTHLSHEVDYEEASRTLPSNVSLAYDGLSIPFTV